MLQHFTTRLPQVGESKMLDAWAGMIDTILGIVTIVDRLPGLEGIIVTTGISGHGVC